MRRLALVASLAAISAGAQPSPLQRGVIVQPESVTVGDPFRVIVRVRAPKGTVLEFPESPDTSTKVEPLDRVVVSLGADTTAVEQTATYRLAAWDTGRLPIRFPDILARSSDGLRRLAVGADLAIEVQSVLPADSAQRVPKPVRPVFGFGVPWWYWLIVAAAAIILGGLFWWWWRRRPRAGAAPGDPYEEALGEFERVALLGLLTAGEYGHYLALMSEVLRTYLARTTPPARTSLTTSELAVALRGESTVPLPRLLRVLHDIDLVKFARHPVGEARAGELGEECRALVEAIHQARQPVEVPRAA
ncbi:MAG: DUF4381 family protein [Gemmatimonadaceae bacterium]